MPLAEQVCLVQASSNSSNEPGIPFEGMTFRSHMIYESFGKCVSTASFRCLVSFMAWGKSNLAPTTLESIGRDWFNSFLNQKEAPQVCQTSKINHKVPGAEDMMTVQPQIKLGIAVILANPAPPGTSASPKSGVTYLSYEMRTRLS